jgi:hypothetical protein
MRHTLTGFLVEADTEQEAIDKIEAEAREMEDELGDALMDAEYSAEDVETVDDEEEDDEE